MTDFSAAAVRPDFVPQAGKHNMAARAFEALRTQQNAAGGTHAADSSQDLSFGDILDIANPLQHIPVVSDIYRSLTGDTISDSAQVAGDVLYGGPLGLVSGVVSTAIQAAEGSPPGEALIAAFGGGAEDTQKTASLAPKTEKPAQADTKEQQLATAYRIGTAWRETAPDSRPVQQASAQTVAEADGKTGDGNSQKPIPQLSASAFNALIASFGDNAATGSVRGNTADAEAKAAPQKHDKPAAKPVADQAEPRLASADPAIVPPSGFAAAMTDGLEKYQAMMQARDKAQAAQ